MKMGDGPRFQISVSVTRYELLGRHDTLGNRVEASHSGSAASLAQR
jgi:hypothetical protein